MHFRRSMRRSLRLSAVVILVVTIAGYLFVYNPAGSKQLAQSSRYGVDVELQQSARVACFGPRGKLLDDSVDDQLHSQILDLPYPQPFGGSHDILGLDKTWMTADGRYGPYGHASDSTTGSSRSSVEWDAVNWALLQDNCLQRNEQRFSNTQKIIDHPTLSLRGNVKQPKSPTRGPRSPRHTPGRTAIVLRSYAGYEYKKEDLTNLRSIIVETALSSGGEYAIFLLVDMKDQFPRIFNSDIEYTTALNATVPQELRSITVLWNEELLRSWYPLVEDHSSKLQIFQPVQLFAQFYPGYDHYWQWELDARLTGNALNYFDSLSKFARNSPRKQAFERASFRYISSVHGTYTDLLTAVNVSVSGKGTFHPVQIAEVREPFGSTPPTADPLQDNFEWGVGEDADFIAPLPCGTLPETISWPFKNYVINFKDGISTPRIYCGQATSRVSWNLLNVVHNAQVEQGLSLASESIIPSFALWHGFKISQPPQPWWLTSDNIDAGTIDEILNGGPPKAENRGFSFGTSAYNSEVLADFDVTTQQNWWWRSEMPNNVMKTWLGIKYRDLRNLPYPLVAVDGKVYAPNMALHPFKTNIL